MRRATDLVAGVGSTGVKGAKDVSFCIASATTNILTIISDYYSKYVTIHT